MHGVVPEALASRKLVVSDDSWQARKTGNVIFLFLKSKLHLPTNRE
jgi:hypothetical protein